MKIRILNRHAVAAFALPAVLVIATGVLILLATLMTVVQLERTTSKARLGSYQADLAVESGLEEAKTILAGVTSTDSFGVGVIPFAVEFDDNGDGSISVDEDDEIDFDSGERGRPYLYAIQGNADGGDVSYNLIPLFATQNGPQSQSVGVDGKLSRPFDPGLTSGNENNLDSQIALRGTPHLQPPVTAWRMIRDQEGVPVARYSYWVEDMQGYLDAEYVPGNSQSGGHARANQVWTERGLWPGELQASLSTYIANGGVVPLWPAPGLNPSYLEQVPGFLNPENRLLNQAAIYTIDQNQGGVSDESSLDDILRSVAPNSVTPASLLALSGTQAPIERVASGEDRGRITLKDDGSTESRWIEENFVTGNRPWDEQALIPFVPGLSTNVMGSPRLNLNRWLDDAEASELPAFGLVPGIPSRAETAIAEFSGFVQNALPEFAGERRGGFGSWLSSSVQQNNTYLFSLAASALDYADSDDTPSIREGSYRGIDSHPLISEYLITHRHEEFEDRNGANFIVITVETFAEIWNMSNHPISGNFELGYTNPYVFEAIGNPEVDFMTPLERTLESNSQSWSTHNLIRSEEDGEWYSRPQNITLPPNGYTLVSTGLITYHLLVSPDGDFLPLPIELSLATDVDPPSYRLRWNGVLCDRSGAGVDFTSLLLDSEDQITKAVIPGTWGEFDNFYTGMYDPRHSWWAGLANPEGLVSENSYPQNYSPGRRTVRYGSIARFDEDALFGRLLVSEWPDGGHDASFDLSSFHSVSSDESERRIRPDDPQLYPGDLSEPSKAPQYISNLGRFVSETELGNIYDPHMWRDARSAASTVEIWYHSSRNEDSNALVAEVRNDASEATVVGGGNTLRIGRPEHEAFDSFGVRASSLLDLFHCGESLSNIESNRLGSLRKVEGHININTASREVLRSLAAGYLYTDPEIAIRGNSFDTNRTFAPRVSGRFEEISATDVLSNSTGSSDEAGIIADAIIAGRPFVSRSQLASLRYPEQDSSIPENLWEKPVFGNKLNHGPGANLHLSDRASEEVFARVYNSATTRSRNFRVHVIGQSLEQTPSGRLRVKATRKKSYRVFANPGARGGNGAIVPTNINVETLYETNL